MAEPTSEPNQEADAELPHELAAELRKFVDAVGGIERAMQVLDDLESEGIDELPDAA